MPLDVAYAEKSEFRAMLNTIKAFKFKGVISDYYNSRVQIKFTSYDYERLSSTTLFSISTTH